MQKLITFGCSITYGHGLPDCHVEPNHAGDKPSKQAWPNLLADYLSVLLKNQSKCGNSNLAILYDILTYKFSKGDIVVVMWSFNGRDLIFGEKNLLGIQKNIPVGVWQDTPLANTWKATHSEADVATRAWLYIHHATLFLNSINIPVYNVFANYQELKKYKPKFFKLPFYDIRIQSSSPIDLALDNRHPGIKTHKLIADRIQKIIKKYPGNNVRLNIKMVNYEPN
jgi:lysophospholipase L1-like esterase